MIVDGEALAVPAEDPLPKRQHGDVSLAVPVASRQLILANVAVHEPVLDEHSTLMHREFPRMFHRGSRVGRELRDDVTLSGAPRATGTGQYSFRQRRDDGHWRLVTVAMWEARTVVKSITGWSVYIPDHNEAA